MDALGTNTEGIRNTAIGDSALGGSTTGDYNVAVGYQALTGGAGIDRDYNIGIGYQSLDSLSSGRSQLIGFKL